MASDAAHRSIEKQLRKMGKVFGFRDFVDATKQAKCEPVEMAFTDFNDWKSGVSQDALNQLGGKAALHKSDRFGKVLKRL
ncbi:hypothetical protein PoB_000523800 [Plakobranchus ocellatus]|uniref:Uncharacterized protein n=1 Tax=Plakobranchus ocellatus TaxID=259542 RepID=A0AAV3Y8H2_9GAST|nr:hypothetical protein PoB_000523800 [Plakobranchus ocellatus]